MLRNCWGGVGWGRDDDILWTWTHGGCYAHMVDATQLLGWGGVGWGGDDDILWTHGGCGVGWGWWHSLDLNTWWMLRNCWGGVGWGGHDDILWTWTHGGCCATAGVGWGGVGMMTFFELEHMVDATQLLGWGGVGWAWWHSLNLNTWWMLRNCGMMTFFELEHMVDATQLCFSCHCTHAGCYATAFAFAWDVENASKLEEAEERTAWYEPCQEKKGPSAARAKVRVAAYMFNYKIPPAWTWEDVRSCSLQCRLPKGVEIFKDMDAFSGAQKRGKPHGPRFKVDTWRGGGGVIVIWCYLFVICN